MDVFNKFYTTKGISYLDKDIDMARSKNQNF